MTTTVKFEIAMLLKEKGFDLKPYLTINNTNPKNLDSNYNPRESQPWCVNLTVTDVVMWLYEKHGIWIYAIPPSKTSWYYNIESLNESFNKETKSGYNSPTEAYEAAIEYCLTNLI